jgi:hypothetical protein
MPSPDVNPLKDRPSEGGARQLLKSSGLFHMEYVPIEREEKLFLLITRTIIPNPTMRILLPALSHHKK